MPTYVLTTADSVLCGPLPPPPPPHGGKVTTASTAKLTVKKAPVLTESSIEGNPVLGCKITDVTGPPVSTHCKTALKVTGGLAKKLTAGMKPVVLDSLSGTTDGVFQGTGPPLKAMYGQSASSKLSAV
ncbi:MAG TPA: hypothetical protein VKA46_16920 [Gemmataceae bacterium]|nr:hypothetical protein [Gemmataceae bacterium]